MGGVALAVVSAVLLILAFPPFHFLLLPFVALVPLGVALGSLRAGPGSGRRAVWMGLSFGVVHWGFLLVWVPLVVAPRFPWAYPGFVTQVALLSGLTGLMAWVTHRLHAGCRVPLGLALPLAWAAMEWLKAHFPLGLSFPWLGLGISLTSWPPLLGIAEWTGEGGVAFWLAAVNGTLASAILAFPGREEGRWAGQSPWLRGALALGLGLLPAVAGGIRARTLRLAPGPTVAVVGTHVPRNLRLLPRESSAEGLAQARRALEGLRPGAADLVILPEATVAIPLDGPDGDVYLQDLKGMALGAGAPVVVGALATSREVGQDGGALAGPPPVGSGSRRAIPEPGSAEDVAGTLTNSAYLVDSAGSFRGRYDKVRLVPGMEWGGFTPGSPGTVFAVDGHAFGPLICYESLFGTLAREQWRAGSRILINLSSDIWFGEEGSRISSLFLHQHAAHLVMRAVETRVGVARAANGGFSFLLDPLGRRVSRLVAPSGGLAVSTVSTYPGVTVFARTGDLLGHGVVLACLLLLGLSFPRLRGPPRSSRGGGGGGRPERGPPA
ncbi:MAG: apolipoprotein N-acyltransferase [Longimicrobiales bacterium]